MKYVIPCAVSVASWLIPWLLLWVVHASACKNIDYINNILPNGGDMLAEDGNELFKTGIAYTVMLFISLILPWNWMKWIVLCISVVCCIPPAFEYGMKMLIGTWKLYTWHMKFSRTLCIFVPLITSFLIYAAAIHPSTFWNAYQEATQSFFAENSAEKGADQHISNAADDPDIENIFEDAEADIFVPGELDGSIENFFSNHCAIVVMDDEFSDMTFHKPLCNRVLNCSEDAGLFVANRNFAKYTFSLEPCEECGGIPSPEESVGSDYYINVMGAIVIPSDDRYYHCFGCERLKQSEQFILCNYGFIEDYGYRLCPDCEYVYDETYEFYSGNGENT